MPGGPVTLADLRKVGSARLRTERQSGIGDPRSLFLVEGIFKGVPALGNIHDTFFIVPSQE